MAGILHVGRVFGLTRRPVKSKIVVTSTPPPSQCGTDDAAEPAHFDDVSGGGGDFFPLFLHRWLNLHQTVAIIPSTTGKPVGDARRMVDASRYPAGECGL
jgi:hypothetical protein